MANLSSRPAWYKGQWPLIELAVTEMAYDNGAIHRNNTEEALLASVMTFICGQFTFKELMKVNAELDTLSITDLTTLICGEQGIVKVSDLAEKILSEALDAL